MVSNVHLTSILWCLAAVLSVTVAVVELPSWLHVCHESDPKLESCLIESVEFLKPYLAAGVPELGVRSIEPLHLDDLLLSGSTTSNGLLITAKDIDIHGSSDYSVSNFKTIKYAEEYTFDAFFPLLYVTGTYNLNGQILLLPLKGSGTFSGNFTNVLGSTRAFITKKAKNGEEYFHLSKLEIKVTLSKGSVKLDNLFNGDRVLGTTINDVINKNFETVSEEILPLIVRSLQRTFRKLANIMASRYTHKQLFPK